MKGKGINMKFTNEEKELLIEALKGAIKENEIISDMITNNEVYKEKSRKFRLLRTKLIRNI